MHCQHTHTHRIELCEIETEIGRESERESETHLASLVAHFARRASCCFSFFLLRIFNFSHCQRDASASSSSSRGSIVTVAVVVVTRCRGCRSRKEDEFARLYFGSFAAQLICENPSRTSQSIISIRTHTSYSLSLTHTHTLSYYSPAQLLSEERAPFVVYVDAIFLRRSSDCGRGSGSGRSTLASLRGSSDAPHS